jgi:hypothetical protein
MSVQDLPAKGRPSWLPDSLGGNSSYFSHLNPVISKTDDPDDLARPGIGKSLADWLADMLASADGVLEVYFARGRDPATDKKDVVLHVWTVLDAVTPEKRRAVYEQEALIIDRFPEFRFDFYATDRRDEPMTTEGYIRVYPS